MLCRGVRVAVGMCQVCINWYAYCVGMRAHNVTERYTAVCSIASEQSRHDSKQHVNMPPARAQEHKWRKAHTYQNTTHGPASSCNTRYLVSITQLLFIIYFFVGTPCGFVRFACSHFPLPTHKTRQANSLQQGYMYTLHRPA